jgi:REP element-mobilizing transposase RayT
MGRKYNIRDNDQFYFVTFTVIDWIDVFTRIEYRNIFLDSVVYCQKEKGLLVGAWCIMTNHVHMMLASNGTNELEDIIRDTLKLIISKLRSIEIKPLAYKLTRIPGPSMKNQSESDSR